MQNSPAKRCLVTGGCGFVGHHFVEHLLRITDWTIFVLDKLSCAANCFEQLGRAARQELFNFVKDASVSL